MTVVDQCTHPGTIYTSALRGQPCHVVSTSGEAIVLPVSAWQREADQGDDLLLALCQGPALDVGCGPGRMVRRLLDRGVPALGIDLVREAVDQARRRGVPALRLDVFGPVPGEGRWATVLLADGNIGIGGDPFALLERCRHLLGHGGRVVADLAAPGTGLARHQVRLRSGPVTSMPFAWAEVGPESVAALAAAAGLVAVEVVEGAGRWRAVLEKPASYVGGA